MHGVHPGPNLGRWPQGKEYNIYILVLLCSTLVFDLLQCIIACLLGFCNNLTWEQGNYLEIQMDDKVHQLGNMSIGNETLQKVKVP